MKFIKSHDTLNTLIFYLQNQQRFFFCRLGDGDVLLANGGRAGWQSNMGNITKEAQEFLALSGDGVLKTFPADSKKYGIEDWKGHPVGVEAVECNTDKQSNFVDNLMSLAKKFWTDIDSSNAYSVNCFWYPACYDISTFVNFFQILNKSCKNQIYIGNENDQPEILKKLFNNLSTHIKTPPRDAYSQIERIYTETCEAIEKFNEAEYVLVAIASGCSGRCLGKRLWKSSVLQSKTIAILDLGSVIDALHNRITRGWIRKETMDVNLVLSAL